MQGLTVEGHNANLGVGGMEVFHILIVTMAQGCIHLSHSWTSALNINALILCKLYISTFEN